MTPLQITKALKKAEFDMSSVASTARDALEILVSDNAGQTDYKKTEKAMRAAQKAVPSLTRAVRTGCGSWVLTASTNYDRDFNDKSSTWHY